jgi:protein-tyrosine phosphatase
LNSKRFIDWHCHLLPGLDDGPAHIDDSVAMAAALHKAGFASVYCTPHLLKGAFDADNDAVRAAAMTLQKRLKEENVDLGLFIGREYYMDEFLSNYLKDPLPLGGTRFLLIEIPNNTPDQLARDSFFRIKCSGFIPMIAHPERCNLFAAPRKKASAWFPFFRSKHETTAETQLISYLSDLGCAFQGNLGSFSGWYGSHVQQTARSLEQRKIYTHFGTDAHSLQGIEELIASAIQLMDVKLA